MRLLLGLAGLNGAMAVAAGAYAAHGLTAAGPQAVRWMEMGSTYQLLHGGLGLALLAVLLPRLGGGIARWLGVGAAVLFLAGVAMFCGALYGLALGTWFVPGMAPFGGSSFILGWLCLGAAGLAATKPTVAD